MKRRIVLACASVAAACGFALATPAIASAAPIQPTPAGAFGSASLCFGVPVGPVSITICI